ncbi:hypothetical protein BCON_0043g00160 [Botryotinia convoluta]|uniref:Uncharacterized protein n=1 Tax=Botryotinia convoluta TaxID=54673 RepID=A0A4Z1IDN8_9HELO|nr:hypothetical protein BCON_0043g00160 [Botryotinia convoluta]
MSAPSPKSHGGVRHAPNERVARELGTEAESSPNKGFTPISGNAEAEAIAVIGMALKFPQEATSTEAFWQMLYEGRCAMTEFPRDRFNVDSFYNKERSENGTIPLRGGHFLREDLGAFDAPFFSVTPDEAMAMDPQQRIMLETSYQALENAGLPIDKCSGSKTSVYTATFTDDYKSMLMQDPEQLPKYAATGLSGSMLANRVSWFFNFHGPSMNLDSACSSSLSALHIACQDLINSTSRMALVGGCNLVFHPDFMLIMSNMSFLSPDSRCWSFDHRANGYARGDGFGVVVLKKLSHALEDGDTIRAVIRATGLNQDGRTPGGITQPSGEAQKSLIKETFAKANLDMTPVRFFEAHGTGTALGDPIEANAIGESFRSFRSEEEPLLIGAVKSNIGHLEGGSGIAGLIKTVLILERGIVLPNTGLEKINPKIDIQRLHIAFPTVPIPWPTTGLRRACINSFGFGGSNAVVIVDDALNFLKLHGLHGRHRTLDLPMEQLKNNRRGTKRTANGDHKDAGQNFGRNIQTLEEEGTFAVQPGLSKHQSKPRLLVWSAADEVGIQNMLGTYSTYFQKRSQAILDATFNDIVHTLEAKRSVLAWRSYAVATSSSDLQSIQKHTSKPIRSSSSVRSTAFVFSGQGAQYAKMGRGLLIFPLFERRFAELEQILRDLGCKWSLRDLLHSSSSDIDKPEFSQTFSTALQIAIVDLLRSFGVIPTAVVGHSSGEIAAAYSIGAISERTAMGIAFHRGRLASSLPKLHKGPMAMLAVALSEEEIQPFIAKLEKQFTTLKVQIGCVNSPKSVTLTGDEVQLEVIASWLKENQCLVRKLRVNVAYHSSYMNAIKSDYLESLQALDMKISRKISGPMLSSVSGSIIPSGMLCDPEYWVTNLVSQVRFSHAVSLLCIQSGKAPRKHLGPKPQSLAGITELIEIGPHSTLQGPLREILTTTNAQHRMTYISALNRQKDAAASILEATGRLWSIGYPVNVAQINNLDETPRSVLTDLPTYPFNHTNRHWFEDRTSTEFRFRRHPRHELLGSLIPTSNAFETRWRNFLRLEKLQWIQDHQVSNDCLLPGAAMLAMAIEGMKQIFAETHEISGFDLRDVHFVNALQVPESADGIEIQVSLTTTQSKISDRKPWYTYRLFSFGSEWVEHCHCSIRIDVQQQDGVKLQHTSDYHQELLSIGDACTEKANIKQFYDVVRENGMNYGPAFQTLDDVRFNQSGAAVANIRAFRSTPYDESNNLHYDAYTVHPSILDGLFQLVFPALNNGGTQELPAMVPSYIRKFLIYSNEAFGCSSSLLASTSSKFNGYRGTESTVIAISPTTGSLFSVMEGYQTTFVSASQATPWLQTERPLLSHLEWRPDITCLSSEQIAKLCEQARPQDEDRAVLHRLRMLVRYYIATTLNTLKSSQPRADSFDSDRFTKLLENQQDILINQESCISTSEWAKILHSAEYRNSIENEIKATNRLGHLYVTIGRNLLQIIQGELSLDGFEETADAYVNEQLASPKIQNQTEVYFSHLAHKNPLMKVIELGRNETNAVSPWLQALSTGGNTQWLRYDYTEASSDNVLKAQKVFGSFASRVHFKVLDIQNDPAAQGFEEFSYDMVIAAHVLRSTSDLSRILTYLRRLLKPGGKLILAEVAIPQDMRLELGLNLISDLNTHLSKENLSKILVDRGFAGIDFSLKDSDNLDRRETSVIVSSVPEQIASSSLKLPDIAIVIDNQSTAQANFALRLKDWLEGAENTQATIYDFRDAVSSRTITGTFCIFLLEYEKAFFATLDRVNFDSFKNALSMTKDILWVVRDAQKLRGPEFHLVDGLSRALRSEDPGLRFARVTLEHDTQRGAHDLKAILNILRYTIMSPLDDMEPEYEQRNGMLYINRVIQSQHMNKIIGAKILSHQKQTIQLDHTIPLTATLKTPGMINSIIYEEAAALDRAIDPDEVIIKIRAVGLTFRDYQVASGQLNDQRLFSEGSGIIEVAGSKSGFCIGDVVVVSYPGACTTLLKCKSSFVAHFPSHMSFTEAAALPTSTLVTYHALINAGNLAKDEFVLIHHAAGALGQAAIQISQNIGARVIVTTSSEEKAEILRATYHLPTDRILSIKDLHLSRKILQVTGGHGVDLALCFQSGDEFETSLEVLAPFGRMLNLGLGSDRGSLDMINQVSSKCISHISLDLAEIQRLRPLLIQKLFKQTASLIRSGIIKPAKPLNIYRACDIEQAMQSFQAHRNTGKIVIDLDPKLSVPALITNKPSYCFDSSASYLIAGGFGGLGRSLSRWMVDRGARNLIILGRSGVKNESARRFVGELKALNVRVEAPACDIAQVESLRKALEECSKRLPPVRGCFQCSMVLRDAIFDNMTHDDFATSTRPKVHGSWNLHSLLPKGMDFFVLLSSIGGILGATSQANYCAGNTYMDALARYRTTIGEKAVSIDLGMMVSEGVVAETEGMLDSLRRLGYFMDINQAEFHSLLDYYCNPELPLLSLSESQIIVGIEHPASMEGKGLEVPPWMTRPMFRHFSLIDRDSADASSTKQRVDSELILRQSASMEIAVGHAIEWIITKVAQILGTKAEEMDVNKPVHINGINSLVAVELRNWFGKKIGADVAVFEILGNMSIGDLAKYAISKSRFR